MLLSQQFRLEGNILFKKKINKYSFVLALKRKYVWEGILRGQVVFIK